MSDEDYEPQRVLGFPVARGDWRPRQKGSGQGAFGVPLSRVGPRPALDTRWARHPVRWLRWRAQVRRLGPYAPDYEEPAAGEGDHD